VTGSFVIVASLVDSLLDASNLSSVIGTVVVSSAFLAAVKASLADADDVDGGGESLKNLLFASSSDILNLRTSPS
jgi:dihydropteroate synthase